MDSIQSINTAATKLEIGVAFSIMNANKGILIEAIGELEKTLIQGGVSPKLRVAAVAFLLQEYMFELVSASACCEKNHKTKLERFGESLRADALKRANDPSVYYRVMSAMNKPGKADCLGVLNTPPSKPN